MVTMTSTQLFSRQNKLQFARSFDRTSFDLNVCMRSSAHLFVFILVCMHVLLFINSIADCVLMCRCDIL